MARIKPRNASHFTHSIGYDEWVTLTLIRPAIIGLVCGGIGLVAGLVLGGLL